MDIEQIRNSIKRLRAIREIKQKDGYYDEYPEEEQISLFKEENQIFDELHKVGLFPTYDYEFGDYLLSVGDPRK